MYSHIFLFRTSFVSENRKPPLLRRPGYFQIDEMDLVRDELGSITLLASETLTGVTQLKIGDICLFYIWTYVCHFVL